MAMLDKEMTREQLIAELSVYRGKVSELSNSLQEQAVLEGELRRSNDDLVASRIALEKEQRRYFELFEYAPDSYVITDGEGIIRQANQAAIQFFSLEVKSLVGRPLMDFVLPDDERAFVSQIGQILSVDAVTHWELRLVNAMGKVCHSLVNVKVHSVSPTRVFWLIRDISDRKQMEEELRSFPSKLIAAQEEERKRVAGDLHDSIGQTLVAVKFWLELVLHLTGSGESEKALTHLENFIPTLQRLIDETRSIYMGLRPTILDNLGLLATLDWLHREFQRLYPRYHIELEISIVEEEIPEILKIIIFRIVQEALNNVVKHSGAEWVDIFLAKKDGQIQLRILDDGNGFDMCSALQNGTTNLGLTSMRERAEITGGEFSIKSVLKEGTTIDVVWNSALIDSAPFKSIKPLSRSHP
jgi:PAS domain S-box-containing protein